MLENFKEIMRLVKRNWRALVTFELLYKLSVAIIFIPLLSGSFYGIMRISGYTYLTRENTVSFLLRPTTLILLVLYLLLAAGCTMIDISAVIYTLECSRQDVRAGMRGIIVFAVRNAMRVWHWRNLLIIVVALILMPFLNVGMASGVISTLSVPEFIMDYIQDTNILLIAFYGLVAFLVFIMLRWLYAFHYYTLEGLTFNESRRKSIRLSRGHHGKDLLTLFITQAGFIGAYIGLFFLATAVAVGISRVFSNFFVLRWLTGTAVYFAIVFSLFFAFALAGPVICGCISSLFYYHKKQAGEEIVPVKILETRREVCFISKRVRKVRLITTGIVVAACLTLGFFLTVGWTNPQAEYIRKMEITAHRGASAYYPENTMAAFRGAKEMGADWAELDVQQTKDGYLIVIHDTNTKRTTGVDAYTWNLTYEQVSKLDAGSFFSKDFAGEKIPLLAEVLDYAKTSGLKLNIELKPTGHEKDFEKSVVDIIREYDFEDKCVITSQNYGVLKNIKEYAPDITTVYVTNIAFGRITQLAAADYFSIESTSATRKFVSRLHNEGKQVYVWTVNREYTIKKMIERNVDNIITDDIILARKCIDESRYSNLLSEFMKLLIQ